MAARNDLILAMEKAMLFNWERDGKLYRTVMGIKAGETKAKGKPEVMAPTFVEDTKHARLAALSMVIIHKCDVVFHIAEGWGAYFPIGAPLQKPSEMAPDDRDEFVLLTVATKSGQYLAIEYKVDRTTRKLVERRVIAREPEHDATLGGLWAQAERIK